MYTADYLLWVIWNADINVVVNTIIGLIVSVNEAAWVPPVSACVSMERQKMRANEFKPPVLEYSGFSLTCNWGFKYSYLDLILSCPQTCDLMIKNTMKGNSGFFSIDSTQESQTYCISPKMAKRRNMNSVCKNVLMVFKMSLYTAEIKHNTIAWFRYRDVTSLYWSVYLDLDSGSEPTGAEPVSETQLGILRLRRWGGGGRWGEGGALCFQAICVCSFVEPLQSKVDDMFYLLLLATIIIGAVILCSRLPQF